MGRVGWWMGRSVVLEWMEMGDGGFDVEREYMNDGGLKRAISSYHSFRREIG